MSTLGWNQISCRNLEEVREKDLKDGTKLLMTLDYCRTDRTTPYFIVFHVEEDNHVKIEYNGLEEDKATEACTRLIAEAEKETYHERST